MLPPLLRDRLRALALAGALGRHPPKPPVKEPARDDPTGADNHRDWSRSIS